MWLLRIRGVGGAPAESKRVDSWLPRQRRSYNHAFRRHKRLLCEALEHRLPLATLNELPITPSDVYATSQDATLRVAAPDMLTNDRAGGTDDPAALAVSEPAYETLSLLPAGNFELATFGAEHVYPGHALYIGFSGVRTGGAKDNVYIRASDLP